MNKMILKRNIDFMSVSLDISFAQFQTAVALFPFYLGPYPGVADCSFYYS